MAHHLHIKGFSRGVLVVVLGLVFAVVGYAYDIGFLVKIGFIILAVALFVIGKIIMEKVFEKDASKHRRYFD